MGLMGSAHFLNHARRKSKGHLWKSAALLARSRAGAFVPWRRRRRRRAPHFNMFCSMAVA